MDLGVGTFELISSCQMKLKSGGTGNLGMLALTQRARFEGGCLWQPNQRQGDARQGRNQSGTKLPARLAAGAEVSGIKPTTLSPFP